IPLYFSSLIQNTFKYLSRYISYGDIHMSDFFSDLESQSGPSIEQILCQIPKKALPRHKKSEWFVKGPLPWAWFAIAIQLHGKACGVGLMLWRTAGWKKDRTFTFSTRGIQRPPMCRGTVSRALHNLESAGLISIRRAPGCAMKVTILDVQ